MSTPSLAEILEAVLLAADHPLTLEQLQAVFDEAERPTTSEIRDALIEVQVNYITRSMELKEVASGWRMQVRDVFAPWVK